MSVGHDVLFGPPALALIKEVLRSDHDLLMRSHARDLVARGPKPFGDVARQLFRQCPCPVWAVGPGVLPQYPSVVGAVQPNEEDPTERELNTRVIELASFIADLERGTFTLLHAWRPLAESGLLNQHSSEDFSAYLSAAERRAAESLRALRDSFGRSLADVHIDLQRGSPEQVIPEFVVAQGIDLVVVGTLARTGVAGLVIGNTAERLLHKIPCSVLAVKPRGFRSPVRLEELG